MDKLLLRGLSPNEQITTLVNHPNALELVQSLPAEELLLTVKKVGLDDSLELIELLSSEQVKVIFDLDIWQNDAIDNEALTQWLQTLEAANPDTALEQMRDADIELLTLMLRECAEIHDLIENDDPNYDSDLVLYTSDRHYVLAFKTDEAHELQSRFLKRFIEDLMGRDFYFAIRLIESARFETESLLHDDALRLRDGRLQDLGFLPMAEARSILTYVDIDSAKTSAIIPEVKKPDAKTPQRLNYDIPSLSGLPFLRESLLGLSHATLENSWGYIVTVANRVHMAQYGKYSDVDAVNETAKYSLNFMEMALSYLCEGDLSRAKNTYLSHTPQDLFKMGHSLVLRLQRDFQKLWRHPAFTLATTSLTRLDSPLREVTRGALQTEPLFYAGLTDPKRIDYRHFESLRDVAQTSGALSEAAFRCALLGPTGLGFVEAESSNTTKASFGVLLATFFAHLLLGQEGSFRPLSVGDFEKFFNRLEKTASGRRLSEQDKARCIAFVKSQAPSLTGLVGMRTQDDAQQRASGYAHIIFGLIETELGKISDDKPHSKFITSLLIENQI